MMTRPRIVKFVAEVWHCRSREYWGTGYSPAEAYSDWKRYIDGMHAHAVEP